MTLLRPRPENRVRWLRWRRAPWTKYFAFPDLALRSISEGSTCVICIWTGGDRGERGGVGVFN